MRSELLEEDALAGVEQVVLTGAEGLSFLDGASRRNPRLTRRWAVLTEQP